MANHCVDYVGMSTIMPSPHPTTIISQSTDDVDSDDYFPGDEAVRVQDNSANYKSRT